MDVVHSIDPFYALSGFCVGALVGMSGVGGGSLMTPLRSQPQRCACHGERRRRTGHSTWARPTGFAVDSPLEQKGFELWVPL